MNRTTTNYSERARCRGFRAFFVRIFANSGNPWLNHNHKVPVGSERISTACPVGYISISNRRSAGVINAHITPLPKVAV